MSGLNIIIERVHSNYTANFIEKYFADNSIAVISRITLMPILNYGKKTHYNTAYITIYRWLPASTGICFALTFGSELGEYKNVLKINSHETWYLSDNKYNYFTHDIPGYTTNFKFMSPDIISQIYDIEAQQFVDLV